MTRPMTRTLLTCLLLAFAVPATAQDCYADYKAKQDNPLKLQYGVAAISGACSTGAATRELAPRLQKAGWTLLNVVSVFGPDGLDQRKANAGAYFLRY
ncbi:hypothetical protein LA6_000264 [Marinibacterium anthonyi]|nr:hypothetical protein LA6_000264 [Marinibacterium anthonyi]